MDRSAPTQHKATSLFDRVVSKTEVEMPFSEKQDLKLIRAVRANPLLYDHNDCLYMDFNAREVIWQKIGDQLRCPASECKARWINIRDINRRIMRKKLNSPEQKGNLYKYASELLFMKSFYKDVMIQNAAFSESGDNNDDTCKAELASGDDTSEDFHVDKRELRSSGCSKRKKKKTREVEAEKPTAASATSNDTTALADLDPSDQVDSFLISIGATLKTFSPYHLNLAKSQIFAVVQEHDLQQIVKHGQATSTSGGQFTSHDSNFKSIME